MNYSKKNHEHHKTNKSYVIKKLITIVLLATIIVGCNDTKKSKENRDKVKQSNNKEFLTAKIDGVDHSFSDRVDLNSTEGLSQIINGKNKESKTRITLGLNLENQKTGTFELSGNMVLVYHSHTIFKEKRIYYLWHAKESVKGSSGTITITKNSDAYIEGTFSFEGVGNSKIDRSVKKITEGKFRVLKK